VSRDYRAGLRRHSLTYRELRERAAIGVGEHVPKLVLRDELAAGRVEVCQRRYRLNGHLPAEVTQALRDLEL
jgi:hypothetical protein